LPVEITFIRHAESEGNAAGRWQGHTNSSLTDRGREQAERVARRLSDKRFDLIVASDLDRTMATAGALGETVEKDERWREPHLGRWEDKTTEEVVGDGNSELDALMAGEDVALGGGERPSEVHGRTRAALTELVERVDGDGSVAVVSHGMALLTLISGLLETRLPSPLRLLGNTAIAQVVVDGGQSLLARYNDDTHLGDSKVPPYGFAPDDTDLLLMRHGQTRANLERRWQGHQDGQLTDEGRRQAELLAGNVPRVAALYASPLARAADTARPIAATQELEVVHDDRLKEISFGEWEGMTRAEIEERFPEESAVFFNGKDVRRGRTGETFIEVRRRVGESLDDIAGRHPGQTVGVVSHGGVTRAWVTELLGLPYQHRNRLAILGNTAHGRVAFTGRGPSLVSWNLAPHLEAD
jgi:probable phosphoglycerate mutase